MHTTRDRAPLDEWSARRRDFYLINTQHSQQRDIRAPSGIRTSNSSQRAAAHPRLRPRGHPPTVPMTTSLLVLKRVSMQHAGAKTLRSDSVTLMYLSILTSYSRVLEKLIGSWLVKKFPTFYGTRWIITAFTSARKAVINTVYKFHLQKCL